MPEPLFGLGILPMLVFVGHGRDKWQVITV